METTLGIIAGCATTLGPLVTRGGRGREELRAREAAEVEAKRAERLQRRRFPDRTDDDHLLYGLTTSEDLFARATPDADLVVEHSERISSVCTASSRVHVTTSVEITTELEPDTGGRITPHGLRSGLASSEQQPAVVTSIYGPITRGRPTAIYVEDGKVVARANNTGAGS